MSLKTAVSYSLTKADLQPMKLLPIFNRNADSKLADHAGFIPIQPVPQTAILPCIRVREKTSIDLLRNLYDEIMNPSSSKADPRISKFRTSFYVKSEEDKARAM